VYSPAFITVGARKFASQPEDIRRALEEAARETQVFVYETAVRSESELLTKIRQSGIQVNEVNKDAFIAASRGIYEEFGKEVAGAKALIDKAVELGKQ
jgi:TRAP-type C4-dicarboxylate transport system substrate-binding protein